MVNNGYDAGLACEALADGADLVVFGRPFIANPDLPRRLRENASLNAIGAAPPMAAAPTATPTTRRWTRSPQWFEPNPIGSGAPTSRCA